MEENKREIENNTEPTKKDTTAKLPSGITLYQAKQKAQRLVDTLIIVQKKIKKKSPNYKKVIKAANEFIHCHITNPVALTKYENLRKTIAEVQNNDTIEAKA